MRICEAVIFRSDKGNDGRCLLEEGHHGPHTDSIPEVFISVEGGVVQGISIKNAPCIVRIYDFDTEGADEADLSEGLDGEPCVLRECGPNTGDY